MCKLRCGFSAADATQELGAGLMQPTIPEKVGDKIATAAFWTVVTAIGWLFIFALLRAVIPRYPLVAAFLGLLPIAVILAIRWWILRVTNQVKIDAPEQYGYVKNLGKVLFLTVMMSALFVEAMFLVLHDQGELPFECVGVILAAFCGWRATIGWRYVWNACVVVRLNRRKSRLSRSQISKT